MPSVRQQQEIYHKDTIFNAIDSRFNSHDVEGADITLSWDDLPLKWFCQILGWRSMMEKSHEQITKLGESILNRNAALFMIQKDAANNIRVILGCERNESTSIQGTLPGCKIQEIPERNIFPEYPFGGVVSGFNREDIDWDDLIRILPRESLIAVMCRPVTMDNIIQSSRAMYELQGVVDRLASREISRGYTGSSKTVIRDPVADIAGATLKTARKLLDDAFGDGDCHEACLWYLAKTPVNSIATGELLSSRCGGVPIPTMETFIGVHRIAFPFAAWNIPIMHTPKLWENRLTSPMARSALAKWIPIPMDEHPGYAMNVASRNAASFSLFDITPHATQGRVIRMGTVVGSGAAEKLNIDSLTAHMLCSGASGTGKTTALKTLIHGADEYDIPALILEPVKSEFNDLSNIGVQSKVYSSGYGGRSLVFNPFIPEPFTQIYSHIRSLCAAITAATDDLPPIPQALELVVKEVYRRHGWAPNDYYIGTGEARSFPNFRELQDLILPYFRESELYKGEVKVNVSSALFVRISALADHTFLLGNEPFPTQELLSQNAAIQFEGLDLISDKCFFGSVILNQINEYLRRLPSSDQLQHLIVIDEAHNIFMKTNGENSVQNVTGEYISNLLSEIRSFGVGVILADQRPGYIHENAIANTATKMTFALEQRQDLDAVAKMFSLSEDQYKHFREMPSGTAIVSVRGQPSIIEMCVEKVPLTNTKRLTMCRYCSYGHLCAKERAYELIRKMPLEEYRHKLLLNMANLESLHRIIQQFLQECGAMTPPEKQCTLGILIEEMDGDLQKNYFCHVCTECVLHSV
jgi:hypothetical protein